MKKNLNIAYLNGAEGMIRRGGASSGGSGSGSDEGSSNSVNVEYYRIDRTAFENSTLGGEYWYDVFKIVDLVWQQFYMGTYNTQIGTGGNDIDFTAVYKIALTNLPKYYDYSGITELIDTGTGIGNFKELGERLWNIETDASYLIPITKEEFYTIEHLAPTES